MHDIWQKEISEVLEESGHKKVGILCRLKLGFLFGPVDQRQSNAAASGSTLLIVSTRSYVGAFESYSRKVNYTTATYLSDSCWPWKSVRKMIGAHW